MSTLSTESSELLSAETQSAYAAFMKLGTDEQLALLYWIYEAMGDQITPAAPTAAEPNLAPTLLADFYTVAPEAQLDVMRQIASKADTDYSRAYGSLTPNNKLLVWFAWAQAMGDTVVDLPDDYKQTQASSNLLNQIEQLDFQDQISVLREVANEMGYSEVQPIPTQADTGKTASL
jgi:Orange carotenoid protein, N-terminal